MKRFLVLFFLFTATVFAQIKSPDDYLGVRIGADKTLIGWPEIEDYFKYVADSSPRVMLNELGKTTMGKPFLMAVISSAENMLHLDSFKTARKKFTANSILPEPEKENLIRNQPAVVIITLNIHSTEIAGSQESVELVYEFASRNDRLVTNILKNTIVLLVPSLNPDGQQMITDWYLKYVNTKYEGSWLPELYHYYAGHDNNRDWHFFNLKESQLVAKVLYHDWFPEVVFDQHQMGGNGPRMFMPPYSDPVNPNVPPALTAEVNLIGKKVVSDLHDAGFKGLVTGTIFNAYFQGTMSKTPLWHNMVGILSEMASVRIATPVFYPHGSLRGMGPDLPENKTQTNFLDPWPGGWWRLRNIIDYEKAATWSLLDLVATYREKFNRNFLQLNQENILLGSQQAPYGYFIPASQADRATVTEMLQKLQRGGVTVSRLTKAVESGSKRFSAGTWYISTAQPARNYIKDLFERQNYPHLLQYPDGPPLQPYDVTTWNMPLHMGIVFYENDNRPDVAAETITRIESAKGVESGSGDFLSFSAKPNWAPVLALKLLNEGKKVYRSKTGGVFQYTVKGDGRTVTLLSEKGIDIQRSANLPENARELRPANIAVYQGYRPVMDEGWTRWVFDHYSIPYKTITHKAIQSGDLDDFDTLILPSAGINTYVNGTGRGNKVARKLGEVQIPPEYRGGLGKKGVKAIQEFLQKGGRVLAFDQACKFAADSLHLPVKIASIDDRKKFFIPGSLLRLQMDTGSSLAAGMPQTTNIFYNGNVRLKLLPYIEAVETIGVFPENGVLASGWAIGEVQLADRPAMVRIPAGQGDVILYAFRPQHRGQTFATFKLVFNSLLRGEK